MSFSILEAARRVDLFFMQASPIHAAMRRLTTTLNEMRIPFAVAGAMAANAHGYYRTTADINILIRREDLRRFKEHCSGLGWVDMFKGSKNFRDTVNNVNIDTLIVGEFPGDGRSKSVVFPPPESVAEVQQDGIPFVSLKCLLELKLASGMTAAHRFQDLADGISVIRVNTLPLEYAATLDSLVADRFRDLWHAAQVNDDY